MIIRLTTFAVAAWLVLQWDKRRRDEEQHRAMQRPQAKPAEVTTWEGEGGALPVVGSQTGPAPAQP
jgi:hypothetical protein